MFEWEASGKTTVFRSFTTNSKTAIFFGGDKLGMPTITSDAKLLRGASTQGVDFDAIVHPPF